jgi:lipoprotein-anchoring transpeptidase ErfK/SrfK
MIQRQPYLPRFMAGSLGNPMGARALYLGRRSIAFMARTHLRQLDMRFHLAAFVFVNDQIADLFERVPVGTKIIVRQ